MSQIQISMSQKWNLMSLLDNTKKETRERAREIERERVLNTFTNQIKMSHYVITLTLS